MKELQEKIKLQGRSQNQISIFELEDSTGKNKNKKHEPKVKRAHATVHGEPADLKIMNRVRTGYGILEKIWNFEKEIPYMEKLWNLSKMAVPMEKLWNFRFGGKKCVLSFKKMGGKCARLKNVV